MQICLGLMSQDACRLLSSLVFTLYGADVKLFVGILYTIVNITMLCVMYLQTTLDAITEDVLTALNDKNPNVKAETAAFLARCFTKATPTTLSKKTLKPFVEPLTKVSLHSMVLLQLLPVCGMLLNYRVYLDNQ